VIILNLLAVAIGIGLLYTLLLAEAFGLAAGGLVVPGYVALMLTQPWNIVMTLLAAWLTFIMVRSMSSVMVIYGRRRTALMILLGYLFGSLLDYGIGGVFSFPVESELPGAPIRFQYFELTVIGYIIPGLIAIWFERQGVFKTLAGLIVTSVLVRLTLIVIMPDTLSMFEQMQAVNRAGFGRLLEGWLQ